MGIDMTTRRGFIAGLVAAGFVARPTWADVGAPHYVSAAEMPDKTYQLCGLDAQGNVTFRVDLPARGHAAAAHPIRAEAVAFARRPGNFAVVIDCALGGGIAHLRAPEGRHFYGHGAFSHDGHILFTTENDFETGAGVIGQWDAQNGYRRMGEFPSGGVGPHEMLLMPDGDTLVVANGGIETHPHSGRSKLNIPIMRPNLSYLSLTGNVVDQVEIAPELHKNSMRHLAVRDDGLVAVAMQWQGGIDTLPPLVATHVRGGVLQVLHAPPKEHRRMNGYAGSVAISATGKEAAITSPRGGLVQVFSLINNVHIATHEISDVCGISANKAGFLCSSGAGDIGEIYAGVYERRASSPCRWDNHLVAI